MSVENVLKSFRSDEGNRLADAWRDYEREEHRRFDALGVEIAKARNYAATSSGIALATLAALLAATLYVGPELGKLSANVTNMQGALEKVEKGLADVQARLAAGEGILKEINERTKDIMAKRQASLTPSEVDPARSVEPQGGVEPTPGQLGNEVRQGSPIQ